MTYSQSLNSGGFASMSGSYINANTQLDFNVGEGIIGEYINSNNMLFIGTLQPETINSTVPTTQLRSIDCGKLNLTLDAQFAALPVPNASLYHFEFKDANTGNFYAQKISSSPIINPSMTIPALLWNHQYLVRVKVYLNGQWGEFGNSCTIGLMQDPAISGVPNTSVRPQFCSSPNITINTVLLCTPVSMANRYEFKFTNTTSGVTHIFNTPLNCPINSVVPSLIPGQNYNVQVRARVYTTWGNFGNICNITIAAPQIANREEQNLQEENFIEEEVIYQNIVNTKLTSFPNPMEENTTILFETSMNEKCSFLLFDMQGRLIQTFSGLTNTPVNFYNHLSVGCYVLNAISLSGEQHQIKIIKTN